MSSISEPAESSDLDDLLDEAMDIVNEEERKHEEEVKVRDAELNDKINAALEEKTAGNDDANAEMLMANLMKLIGTLKEGSGDDGNSNSGGGSSSNDMMDEESLNKLKHNIDSVIAQMEHSEFLTAEDKQSIQQVQNLIALADSDPSKVDEFLSTVDALKANPSNNPICNSIINNNRNTIVGEGNTGGEMNANELQNLFAAIANCQANNTNLVANNVNHKNNNIVNNSSNATIQSNAIASSTTLPLPIAPSGANDNNANSMEALSQGLQQYFTSSANQPPESAKATTSKSLLSSELTPVAEDTKTNVPENLVNSATDQLANMLITTFCDPEFVEPIRLMRDAYDGWLRSHEATLSVEEKERYEKQYEKTKEICEFFAVPLSADDDQRIVQLMELMSQFSELGNTPDDLCNYNENK